MAVWRRASPADYTNGSPLQWLRGAPSCQKGRDCAVDGCNGTAGAEDADTAEGGEWNLQRGGAGGRELPRPEIVTDHGQDGARVPVNFGAVSRRWTSAAVRRKHSRGRHCGTLPTGLEFARYSIDYHYIRNQLFATTHGRRWAAPRAAVRAICEPYADDVEALKNPPPPALAPVPRLRWCAVSSRPQPHRAGRRGYAVDRASRLWRASNNVRCGFGVGKRQKTRVPFICSAQQQNASTTLAKQRCSSVVRHRSARLAQLASVEASAWGTCLGGVSITGRISGEQPQRAGQASTGL